MMSENFGEGHGFKIYILIKKAANKHQCLSAAFFITR